MGNFIGSKSVKVLGTYRDLFLCLFFFFLSLDLDLESLSEESSEDEDLCKNTNEPVDESMVQITLCIVITQV